jgi:hypothetical protein
MPGTKHSPEDTPADTMVQQDFLSISGILRKKPFSSYFEML